MHLIIPADLKKRWKAVVAVIAHKQSQGTALSYRWSLDEKERAELKGWLAFNSNFSGITINSAIQTDFSLTIFCDASGSGVGSVLYFDPYRKLTSFSPIPEPLLETSSTFRELLAILEAAKAFSRYIIFEKVLFYCDNQAAVTVLKKGSAKPDLQGLAIQIWDLLDQLRIRTDFAWIPRTLNSEADQASRFIDLDDWSISNSIFAELQNAWGTCTLDMFASEFTAKCSRFVSRWVSQQTLAVDAFSIEARKLWGSEFLWWVPPPYLIARSILVAKQCGTTGILGFPLWESNLFYPLLRKGDQWIPEIKDMKIYPAGFPVLNGFSHSHTFGCPYLQFDFAFALIDFPSPAGL
ncbi:unnamed protein product [Cylicostephanus goldi]|uniref:RNase H type-1 domain-containing protein n=1 Tax=Cylicostephanus goldi TaxID=71465 RepID=A0A3P6TLU1_CYLGO|nr:unnamed protein product [Cylicostephanus goldi]